MSSKKDLDRLDPRRLGKQNSGFSDEDISDIICVLYPHTDAARQEVQALAQLDCPHVIGRDEADVVEADVVEPDYNLEDHASRFETNPVGYGNYAIILRLSSHVKNPATGFAFGRNSSRCDIVFSNDPHKRISNIHFRIYVNEYGNIIIEDQSTNGTSVDRHFLTAKPKDTSKALVTQWVLSSGSVITIYLHNEQSDLTFRVRIPRRNDEYNRTYINKVEEYFARHGLQAKTAAPATTNNGPPDIFKAPAEPAVIKRVDLAPADPAVTKSPSTRRDGQMRREWSGSGTMSSKKDLDRPDLGIAGLITVRDGGAGFHMQWQQSTAPRLSQARGAETSDMPGAQKESSYDDELIGDELCKAFEFSEFSKRFYLPLNQLHKILSPDVVLKLLGLHFESDMSLRLQTKILGSVSAERRSLLRIFAILVILRRVKRVRDLIDRGIDDTYLPFTFSNFVEDSHKVQLCDSYRRPFQPESLWSKQSSGDFLMYQNVIHVPFFQFSRERACFYELGSEVILPFSSFTPQISEGYGSTIKARIHHGHHNFQHDNREVINSPHSCLLCFSIQRRNEI